jgi:hypothetical protein
MEYVLGAGLFLAAVATAFFVIRVVAQAVFGPSRRLERDLGVEVLRGRMSRGEISRAQFEVAAAALGANSTAIGTREPDPNRDGREFES